VQGNDVTCGSRNLMPTIQGLRSSQSFTVIHPEMGMRRNPLILSLNPVCPSKPAPCAERSITLVGCYPVHLIEPFERPMRGTVDAHGEVGA